MKPTESAEFDFNAAIFEAKNARGKFINSDTQNANVALASAIANIAAGLGELAVGLRATYDAVEKQQKFPGKP